MKEFVRTGYTGRCTLQVGSAMHAGVPLTSPAAFMATNASHALMAYDVLRRRDLVPEIDAEEIARLFGEMDLSACCEVLPGTPTIVLDGAHNAPAAARLTAMLRTTFEGRRSVWLVSLCREAQWEQVLRSLAGTAADRLIVTCYPPDRAVAPQMIAERWRAYSSVAAEIVEHPDAAFRRAREAAGFDGVVVVTGSPQWGGYCRPLAKTSIAALTRRP